MNDQSQKKITSQNRLNILDLALLLLALLAVIAIWQRENLRFFFEGDRVKSSYSVSFTVSAVRDDTADLLTADTMVYLKTDGAVYELGRLSDDADRLPCAVLMPRADGGTAEVILPADDPAALFDLNATFVCRGILRDGALVLDSGVVLRPEMEMLLLTERGEMWAFIRSITENV